MVSGDMGELAEIIRQAVKLSGVRAVVALGWGQQEAKTKDANIFYVKSVPHDWLFPHMAGAVHHGGAGTTATSLRHALPTLVVPFGGDQPFWAERVYAAGCGPKAIPRDIADGRESGGGAARTHQQPGIHAQRGVHRGGPAQ